MAVDRNGVRVIVGDLVENTYRDKDGSVAQHRHVGVVEEVDGDTIVVRHRCCPVKDVFMAKRWMVLR